MAKRVRVYHPRTELLAWLYEANRTAEQLAQRCTSTHPNHEFLTQPIKGLRQFWQAWCSVCEKAGWGRNDTPNPEMSPAHIEAYDNFWAVPPLPPSPLEIAIAALRYIATWTCIGEPDMRCTEAARLCPPCKAQQTLNALGVGQVDG